VIRLLVVDDHKVVRQGMRFLLSQEADIEVVGECENGAQAIEAVVRLQPDVVLLDLLMPVMDGITALASIVEAAPLTRVIILTSDQDDGRVMEAIRGGALSYLLKTAGVEEVIESVHAAARGESTLHPIAASRLMQEVRRPRDEMIDELTARELEVLGALARGRSNKEIARALGIREQTVKTHVANILSKLHLADRHQAAIYALQRRLVPLDSALE
jgi:NarL family two-component system response regulator LiaR